VKPWTGRRLHFVGIGGAGMSGLALVARELGAEVTGSDRSPDSPFLRRANLTSAAGHDAANVPPGAEVVYSSAIPPDNPERMAAAGRELHRADLLGELTRLRPTIAVTGTHGKTTTASMIVHALRGCELDPAYLVGGEVRSTGSNAGWGTGEWLVVEADESDRSLLKLQPTIAVLTNAELDHHATYSSQRDVDDTFRAFLAKADHVVLGDEPDLARFESAVRRREDRAVIARPERTELDPSGSTFTLDGMPVRLHVPGTHNARNAATALVAARLAGADPRRAAEALEDFSGAGRRFERVGTTPTGALVVDDYAHHPTEVRATIAAARTLAPNRVIAVFQPHLFSRTRHQHREFGAALALADEVVVLDVYPARERAEDFPGVTGRLVAAATADHAGGRRVAWLPSFDAAERFLADELKPGDLLLTLGAGNVDMLARTLLLYR
jgi:UDP-N-acetylmuramate--alanine ligase